MMYSMSGYKIKLKQTKNKHIMVEGSTDLRVINSLLENITTDFKKINVDTAEIIKSPNDSQLGNREKVEFICNNLESEFKNKFVGLVDREFREFNISEDKLEDNFEEHYYSDFIVWTLGHSIENYFFDFKIMKEPLKNHTTTSNYNDALDLLNNNFNNILNITSALSLTALEESKISMFKSLIKWDIFELSNGKLMLDLEKVKMILIKEMDYIKYRVPIIIDNYKKWIDIIENRESDISRWVTHGHLGFKIIWSAYARCLYEVNGNSTTEIDNLVSLSENARISVIADNWASKFDEDYIIFPLKLFEKIDLF